jgi:hypothetical protein
MDFKLALVQLFVTADKAANLQNARQLVLKAAQNGANIVCLPVRTFIQYSILTHWNEMNGWCLIRIRNALIALMEHNTLLNMLSVFLKLSQRQLFQVVTFQLSHRYLNWHAMQKFGLWAVQYLNRLIRNSSTTHPQFSILQVSHRTLYLYRSFRNRLYVLNY